MGDLWGMIRSLRMISLSSLVNVNTPIDLHIFLAVCIKFASMDVFDGSGYYAIMFHFLELSSPSK